MSKTPRAERVKAMWDSNKAPPPAAVVSDPRLTPGMYYTLNIAKTKAAMRQEAEIEKDCVLSMERTENRAKIAAALRASDLPSIEDLCLIPETDTGCARYKRRVGDGRVILSVFLDYPAQTGGDYSKHRELLARAGALRTGLSAAANFSSFCKLQAGGKNGDPLPESQLNVLWERWIEFTCGSRP